jgi:hypothetical protein
MKQDKDVGDNYERTNLDQFRGAPWKLGNRYVVVEWYHFEYEKKALVIDKKTGREYPDLGFDFGTEDDFFAKMVWAQRNGMNPTREDMIVIEKTIPILWVTTFCKDLSLLLENRRDERQLKGKMPFYFWSFLMVNGKSIGLMDLILDAQQDLNKREAAKTKIITSTPTNGKMWVHPDAYGSESGEKEKVLNDMTDSSKPFILDENVPPALASGLFGILQGQQVSPSILQDETMKIDFMSKIGRLPPAMQGFTERSGESGIHLGRKVIEGSVMQLVPMQFLLQKEREKAEDWVFQTLKLMGAGDRRNFFANLNRPFTDNKGEKVILNEVTGYDQFDNPIVKNDMSSLTHVEVDISETKENDFVRQLERESSIASLQAIPPTATNDIIRAEFEGRAAVNMNHATDYDKEQVVEAVAIRKELALESAKLQLMSMKVQEKNLEVTAMQLDQQIQAGGMPPQPPGAGGSSPAPAEGPAPDASGLQGMGADMNPAAERESVSVGNV